VDTSKLAIASAKAMDEIDRFVSEGDIPEDAYIGAVCIIVAIDHRTPEGAKDRWKLRDVSTQAFCFSVPDELYVQLGLLDMASTNYGTTDALADGDDGLD
jgi:hypothetical protein